MDVGHLREQCQQLVPQLVARRGWRLIKDEPAFVEEVINEAQRSLAGAAHLSLDRIIENATLNRYNYHWYLACQAGDPLRQQVAFIELHAYLYNIAQYKVQSNIYLVEECVQETLVRVWQKLPAIKDPGAFMGYAKMTLLREIWHKVAAEKRGEVPAPSILPDETEPDSTLESYLPTVPPPEATPSPQLEQDREAQIMAAIRHCLRRSLARQEVIIGQFLHQKTVKELADELKIAAHQVHLLTFRALAMLRKCPDFLQLLVV